MPDPDVVGFGWFQIAGGGAGYGGTKEKIIGFCVLAGSLLLFLFRRIVQDGERPHWREETPTMPDATAVAAAPRRRCARPELAGQVENRKKGRPRVAPSCQNRAVSGIPEEFDVPIGGGFVAGGPDGIGDTVFDDLPSRRQIDSGAGLGATRRSSSARRSGCSRPASP